jgi:hypothetical protein
MSLNTFLQHILHDADVRIFNGHVKWNELSKHRNNMP